MTFRRLAWGLASPLLLTIIAVPAFGVGLPDVLLIYNDRTHTVEIVAPAICGPRMDLAPVATDILVDVVDGECTINGSPGPVVIPVGPDVRVRGGKGLIALGRPDAKLPLGDVEIKPAKKSERDPLQELPILNVLGQHTQMISMNVVTIGAGHTIQVVDTTIENDLKVRAAALELFGMFDSEVLGNVNVNVTEDARRILLGSLDFGLVGPRLRGKAKFKFSTEDDLNTEIQTHQALFDGKLVFKANGGELFFSDTIFGGKTTIVVGKGPDPIRFAGGSYHDLLKLVLGGGDDDLEIDGLTGTGGEPLTIKGGGGNDTLQLNGILVPEIQAAMGGGDDTVAATNSDVGLLTYKGGGGNDAFIDGGANTFDDLVFRAVEQF